MTSLTRPFASATGTGWTNISRVLVNDSLWAQSPFIANGSNGNPIVLMNPFGSNPIPSTWDIHGVEISIKGKVQNAGSPMFAYQCSLRKNGAAYSTFTPSSANFTLTTDATKVVPQSTGSTYLWGRSSILPADLNDPTFELRVPIRNGGASAQYFYANYITITIYYTDTAIGVSNSQQFFWSMF